jgi:hypothetical protein
MPEISTGRKDIIIALIGLAATIITGFFTYMQGLSKGEDKGQQIHAVPPSDKVTNVDKFPKDTSAANFSLLRDISIYDLRAWKPIDQKDKKKERIQPCHYINYLHIIKTKPIDKFVAHYATSGYGIDLRCISSDFKILKREVPAKHETDQDYIEYQVEIDVSKYPLNKEFLLVVEGTYWNGFSNLKSEDASTYTDDDIDNLQELAIIVFFPMDKPFTSYNLLTSSENHVEKAYRGPTTSFYADENKRFIYWNIAEKEMNKHYKIKWEW